MMAGAFPLGAFTEGRLRFRKHDERSWAYQNLSDSQPDGLWLRFNHHQGESGVLTLSWTAAAAVGLNVRGCILGYWIKLKASDGLQSG